MKETREFDQRLEDAFKPLIAREEDVEARLSQLEADVMGIAKRLDLINWDIIKDPQGEAAQAARADLKADREAAREIECESETEKDVSQLILEHLIEIKGELSVLNYDVNMIKGRLSKLETAINTESVLRKKNGETC